MLKSSSLCLYSSNFGTFWLKIEQFWSFEEISIFSIGWMPPFQNCVRWSRLPTKMATKLKIEKRGDEILKNLLLWNYWANLNQTLLKWSLGGPLSRAILIEGPNRLTNFWKRTIQWLFHQHLVLIEQMVSDKKIFMGISNQDGHQAKNRKRGDEI
jgi:hypothetical protein